MRKTQKKLRKPKQNKGGSGGEVPNPPSPPLFSSGFPRINPTNIVVFILEAVNTSLLTAYTTHSLLGILFM